MLTWVGPLSGEKFYKIANMSEKGNILQGKIVAK